MKFINDPIYKLENRLYFGRAFQHPKSVLQKYLALASLGQSGMEVLGTKTILFRYQIGDQDFGGNVKCHILPVQQRSSAEAGMKQHLKPQTQA